MTSDRGPRSDVDAGAELVEWVRSDGSVIDVVPRRRIRSEVLRHRCVYVVVLTADDELIVHQRAEWKDVYPSYWDLCFGGITGVGEPWEQAAQRELSEEAGIEGSDLVPLGAADYEEDDGRILGRAFLTRHDGPVSCPDGEVVAVDRIARSDLDQWLRRRPICPDSRLAVLPLLLAHWNASDPMGGS